MRHSLKVSRNWAWRYVCRLRTQKVEIGGAGIIGTAIIEALVTDVQQPQFNPQNLL